MDEIQQQQQQQICVLQEETSFYLSRIRMGFDKYEGRWLRHTQTHL